MDNYTPDFSLEVEEIAGVCPAGEIYAKQNIAEKRPLFSLARDPASGEKLPDSLLTW